MHNYTIFTFDMFGKKRARNYHYTTASTGNHMKIVIFEYRFPYVSDIGTSTKQ